MEHTVFGGQVFGAIWVFGWAFFLLLLWHLLNVKKQKILELRHKERMAALEKGVPAPEWPELESRPRREFRMEWRRVTRENPRWALGAGVVLIFLGFGLAAAFLISTDPEFHRIWSLGLIGVFLGAGLVLQHFLTRPGKP